jgi:hypothetical protein
MLRSELATDTPVSPRAVDGTETEHEGATEHEGETGPARILALAATTAEQLVADATSEAESIVAAARASADAALAELADEKAGLEAQIAALRQLQDEHRTQMRQHLSEQLSLLDAALPEAPAPSERPAAVTG